MNNQNSVWDTIPELLPAACELREDPAKLSFELITALLNERFGLRLSRNSVIGRLFRHHQKERKPRQWGRSMTTAETIPVAPDNETIDFDRLKDWHCRFPAGDHPHITYCGAPKTVGSYCDEHHKKAYYVPRRLM